MKTATKVVGEWEMAEHPLGELWTATENYKKSKQAYTIPIKVLQNALTYLTALGERLGSAEQLKGITLSEDLDNEARNTVATALKTTNIPYLDAVATAIQVFGQPIEVNESVLDYGHINVLITSRFYKVLVDDDGNTHPLTSRIANLLKLGKPVLLASKEPSGLGIPYNILEDCDEMEVSIVDMNSCTKYNLLDTLSLRKGFLDVSCLIALVSETCYISPSALETITPTLEPIASQVHAENVKRLSESLSLILKSFDELCTTVKAWEQFTRIVGSLGGTNEQKRCEDLKGKIALVPDVHHPELRKHLMFYKPGKDNIDRFTVFETSHALGGVVVTSNTGIFRSFKTSRISLSHIIHEPRSLSEGRYLPEQLSTETKVFQW